MSSCILYMAGKQRVRNEDKIYCGLSGLYMLELMCFSVGLKASCPESDGDLNGYLYICAR